MLLPEKIFDLDKVERWWQNYTGLIIVDRGRVFKLVKTALGTTGIPNLIEYYIMKQFNHPNIMQVQGIFHVEVIGARKKWGFYSALEMEKIDCTLESRFGKTDMEEELEMVGSEPTDEDRERYISEIAYGLSELHRRGIYHGDIKPNNIFIVKGVAKIADFDLSGFVETGSTQLAGSLGFQAPEILLIDAMKDNFGDSNYYPKLDGRKADLWAFAILVLWIYDYSGFYKDEKERQSYEAANSLRQRLQSLLKRNHETARRAVQLFLRPYKTRGTIEDFLQLSISSVKIDVPPPDQKLNELVKRVPELAYGFLSGRSYEHKFLILYLIHTSVEDFDQKRFVDEAEFDLVYEDALQLVRTGTKLL